MKEIYFTGEPFLYPAILTLLGEALEVAPTTVADQRHKDQRGRGRCPCRGGGPDVLLPGRLPGAAGERLTEKRIEGSDRGLLQCTESRVVAHGGVYPCPILAGLPGPRLSAGGLEESFKPTPLYHPARVTCHETGMSCRNY